jgi:hypothetical protein
VARLVSVVLFSNLSSFVAIFDFGTISHNPGQTEGAGRIVSSKGEWHDDDRQNVHRKSTQIYVKFPLNVQ